MERKDPPALNAADWTFIWFAIFVLFILFLMGFG